MLYLKFPVLVLCFIFSLSSLCLPTFAQELSDVFLGPTPDSENPPTSALLLQDFADRGEEAAMAVSEAMAIAQAEDQTPLDWKNLYDKFHRWRTVIAQLCLMPGSPHLLGMDYLPSPLKEELLDAYFKNLLLLIQVHQLYGLKIDAEWRWLFGISAPNTLLAQVPVLKYALTNSVGQQTRAVVLLNRGGDQRIAISAGMIEGSDLSIRSGKMNEQELLSLYQYLAARRLLHADSRLAGVLKSEWNTLDLLPTSTQRWRNLIDSQREALLRREEELWHHALWETLGQISDQVPHLANPEFTRILMDFLIPSSARTDHSDSFYPRAQENLKLVETSVLKGKGKDLTSPLLLALDSTPVSFSGMDEESAIVALKEILIRAKADSLQLGLNAFYSRGAQLSQNTVIHINGLIEQRIDEMRQEIPNELVAKWYQAARDERTLIPHRGLTEVWISKFLDTARDLAFFLKEDFKTQEIHIGHASVIHLADEMLEVPENSSLRSWWKQIENSADWPAARSLWNATLIELAGAEIADDKGLIDSEKVSTWMEDHDFTPKSDKALKNPDFTAKRFEEIAAARKYTVSKYLEFGVKMGFTRAEFAEKTPRVMDLLPVEVGNAYYQALRAEVLDRFRPLYTEVKVGREKTKLYQVLAQISRIKHPFEEKEVETYDPQVLALARPYVQMALEESRVELRKQIRSISNAKSLKDLHFLIGSSSLQSEALRMMPEAEKLQARVLTELNQPSLVDRVMQDHVRDLIIWGFTGVIVAKVLPPVLRTGIGNRYLMGGRTAGQTAYRAMTPFVDYFSVRADAFTYAMSGFIAADLSYQISSYLKIAEESDNLDSTHKATAFSDASEHLFSHGEMIQARGNANSQFWMTLIMGTFDLGLALVPVSRALHTATKILDVRAQRALGLRVGEWNLMKAAGNIQRARAAGMSTKGIAGMHQAFLRLRTRWNQRWTIHPSIEPYVNTLLGMRKS